MDIAVVQPLEVHQFLQRLFQRRVVIETGGVLGAGRQEPGIDLVRVEHAGLAEQRRGQGRYRVAAFAIDVAIGGIGPDGAVGDAVPEFAQRRQPPLRRIAGDQRGIDGADADTGHPFRLQPRLVECLIDAALIGAQRAAALQHQRDAAAIAGPRNWRIAMTGRMGRVYRFGVHELRIIADFVTF